jgi:membrane protein
MIIKGYRVAPLAKRVGREILDDNVLGLAAQTAYYFFFSLFPVFLFAAPLLGVVGDKKENFALIMSQLRGAVPGEALKLVETTVAEVVNAPGAPGLMSIGALLAAWAGSNIFSALMDSLNRAYDVEETRPWWKRKLIAVAAVGVAGVVLALATIIMLGGEDIAAAMSTRLGLGETGRTIWTVAQFPVATAILIALAWGVFWFLPNVRQDWKQVVLGAVLTTLLWIVVTLLFRFYVQNFGSYNKTYGAIGGVIVLLTWMYLSMLTVLIGGELNSEIHAGTGAINPRRGATIYGGRIASTGTRPSNEQVERLVARGGAE